MTKHIDERRFRDDKDERARRSRKGGKRDTRYKRGGKRDTRYKRGGKYRRTFRKKD